MVSHLGHRLSALIDGELDDSERDRVLVHLAGCEPCRAEAVALRTLKRRMNALGEAAADAALTRRLMGLASVPGRGSQDDGTSQAPGREFRPAWYVTVGAAAAVLVGVGAAAFVAGGGQQPEPRVTPAVDSYVAQHDLMTGVVPVSPGRRGSRATSPSPAGSGSASPSHVPGRVTASPFPTLRSASPSPLP
jgi:anti-sigma factor RsiW